jgi:hypothetical protein
LNPLFQGINVLLQTSDCVAALLFLYVSESDFLPDLMWKSSVGHEEEGTSIGYCCPPVRIALKKNRNGHRSRRLCVHRDLDIEKGEEEKEEANQLVSF